MAIDPSPTAEATRLTEVVAVVRRQLPRSQPVCPEIVEALDRAGAGRAGR